MNLANEETKYLKGWKAIADYVGCHWQTIRYWHYTRIKLPFIKSFPSQQGRVIISTYIVDAWLREMNKLKLN